MGSFILALSRNLEAANLCDLQVISLARDVSTVQYTHPVALTLQDRLVYQIRVNRVDNISNRTVWKLQTQAAEIALAERVSCERIRALQASIRFVNSFTNARSCCTTVTE
jgi:hypothetical protein